MHYTRINYYILKAQPHAVVYLGTKTGIEPQAMLDDLKAAACGEKTFDDALVNQIPARKHDHFLIPAAVHCSGTDRSSKSAPRRLYTFKLWDWGV